MVETLDKYFENVVSLDGLTEFIVWVGDDKPLREFLIENLYQTISTLAINELKGMILFAVVDDDRIAL